MITCGGTIEKVFQIERRGGESPNRLIGSRTCALVLVRLGLVALLLATVGYQHNMRLLRAQYPGTPRSLAVVVAVWIAVLGILALLVMIFQQ